MKAKSSLTLLASLVLITFIFTQCQKGDVGPAGPAGPAGAAGPAGTAGPKGDTGTANVMYSPWLDVDYEPETDANGDTVAWLASITANKLTQTILDRGEMKVYFNWGTQTDPDVAPLPIVDPFFTGVLIINPEFLLQRIDLYSTLDASTQTDAGQKYFQYRYILIPGSVSTGRIRHVDWNNYNEVKAYLGLTD